MSKVTPQEYAEKWARRTRGATQDYVTGVSRVTQAPGAKAAQAKQLWAARIAESLDKWAREVGSVSLADWQQAATQLGAARIGQGVDAALPQMSAVAQQLLSAVDAAAAKVATMPKTTLEDRIARSAAFQREMAKF